MKLTPELLLSAYCQGIFPMANDQGNILWFDPDPRAILPLNGFHISRSLQRIVQQGRFEIHYNSSFPEVIRACAEPVPGRELTWINSVIIESFIELHNLGFAHSVETWSGGKLVGGLYGVAINGFFAGESMFSKARDASKVALVHLIEHLRRNGFLLLDVQFVTEHLQMFGAIEIPRFDYRKRLAQAIAAPVAFGDPNL
jgi:leucyl/phenylalanyl-tRNA---protein transferase